jgi:5-methylcytosine-specific restriction endonuclease McrA
MKAIRLPEYDKPKGMADLSAAMTTLCCIDGCANHLTTYKGPGQDVLCREHQLMLREYGGMGRLDRPHTFHRSWICSECGYNSLEDSRLKDIVDEMIKRRVARVLMHGDHNETRRADGGDDSAANVKCLCFVCHAKKTIINEDYKNNRR